MKPTPELIRAIGFALVLIVLMLVEWLRRIEFTSPAIQSLQADLIDIALSKSTQIPIVIVLPAYFAGLLWIAVRNRPMAETDSGGASQDSARRSFWKRLTILDWCKIGLVVFALAACLPAWTHSEAGHMRNLKLGIDQTTNALVLLTGLVVGCAAEALVGVGANSGRLVRRVVLTAILLFLAATSLFQPGVPHVYKYHGAVRWTGLWVNPNTYGLLMGTGLVLAFCHLMPQIAALRRQKIGTGREAAVAVIWTAAVVLCGFGLLKSYSRGAWLATLCGLAFVAWNRSALRARWNLLAALVAVISLLVLGFWQFRYTQTPLARRVFSVGNINDFSWRNRVTVWAGSLRMLMDRPLLGFGWGRVEAAYSDSYRAPRLEETMAIQLNDFFTLATSAGVPALVCFLGYAGLCLLRIETGQTRTNVLPCVSPADQTTLRRDADQESHVEQTRNGPRWKEECRTQNELEETHPSDFGLRTSDLGVACRAGAVLLLIGFWFDGGLFRLATGPLFWAMAEFSRTPAMPAISPSKGARRCERLRRPEIVLRILAGLLALTAGFWTSVHWIVPRLAITDGRVAFARKHLVPPQALADFDFLIRQPIWRGQYVRTLLDHAELANYNRSLVEWKLEEEVYRSVVLSPQIDPQFDGDLDWRRPLWEYFYPRIRRRTDVETAAQAAFQELQSQIAIRPDGPHSIREMWRRQSADNLGFEALCVAVWRSVGIPSRLNAQRHAEYRVGSEWRAIPRADTQ